MQTYRLMGRASEEVSVFASTSMKAAARSHFIARQRSRNSDADARPRLYELLPAET